VDGARDQRSVAPDISHPLEIPPGEHPTSGEEPDAREASAQRFEQAQIDAAPRPDPTEIQQQDRLNPNGHGLFRQSHGLRPRASGVLHRGMENWIAQPQVEAEYHPGRANHADDRAQIREGVQSLESHHDLAGAAGKNLKRAPGQVRARVHQQSAGKPGVECSQLANQCSLNGTTLDRIEIGDIALMNTEGAVKRAEQRGRIPHPSRDQAGFEGRITRAIARLRVHGDTTGEVQYGYDLHP
jgi:hypothetical protein